MSGMNSGSEREKKRKLSGVRESHEGGMRHGMRKRNV